MYFKIKVQQLTIKKWPFILSLMSSTVKMVNYSEFYKVHVLKVLTRVHLHDVVS